MRDRRNVGGTVKGASLQASKLLPKSVGKNHESVTAPETTTPVWLPIPAYKKAKRCAKAAGLLVEAWLSQRVEALLTEQLKKGGAK